MADAFVVPFTVRDYSAARAISFLGRKVPMERNGDGYLAGEFPDGATTVDGAPVAATVRVMVRKPGDLADGFVVIETQSAPDGTWRVDGLPGRFKYDVVGRKDGFNDVLVADVTPVVG